MTTQEQKDYARGYNAGRKRTEKEIERSSAEWIAQVDAIKSLRAQFAAQIMAALIATDTPWTMGNEKITDMKGRAKLARIGADNLMKELGL